MLTAYVNYCIRLPLGLVLGIVALVGFRIVWFQWYRRFRYRFLLKKRADRNGSKPASGLGPKP